MIKPIKKVFGVILTICLIFGLSSVALAANEVTATPTSSKVLVNGSVVSFQAYNIDGNNYFKLRDIAKAISGTAKQFEIGVDGKNINLASGKVYTTVGGELSVSGSTSSVTATLSSFTVYLDGSAVSLTAYNIGGNNYFKLRDVGGAINFYVGFESASNTISIDTTKGYSTNSSSTSSVLGVWSGIMDGASYLFIFGEKGNSTITSCSNLGNYLYTAGTYTVSGTQITNVANRDGSITVFDYKLNDGTLVISEGGYSITLYRQSGDSLIGVWGNITNGKTTAYIFYSNDLFVKCEISNIGQIDTGKYSVSGNTVSITIKDVTTQNQFSIVRYNEIYGMALNSNGVKLILTKMDSKTL